MNIYIMRHGEAAKNDRSMESQLTADGRRTIEHQALRLANHAALHNSTLASIIHSGKRRAEETAEIIQRYAASEAECSYQTDLQPNDDPGRLISNIQRWSKPTIIVSHLPFIPKLLHLLCNQSSALENLNITPGTIIALTGNHDDWQVDSIIEPSHDYKGD